MPRTETATRALYKFNELTQEQKDQAVQKLYDLNVDHEWWDCTYEDANIVGLNITAFDIDRASYCELTMGDAESTVKLIGENHGEDCDTHKAAVAYQEERKRIKAGGNLEGGTFDNQERIEELEEDLQEASDIFGNNLSECYLTILRKGYEYLTSDEAIIETIEANDYEFDESGDLA